MNINSFLTTFKTNRKRLFLITVLTYVVHKIIVFVAPNLRENFFFSWFFAICAFAPFPLFMLLRYNDKSLTDKKRYTSMFWFLALTILLIGNFVFFFYREIFLNDH